MQGRTWVMHTKYFFQPKSIICFSMLPDSKGGSSSLYIGPQPDRKPSGAWTVGMFPDWLLFVGDVLLLLQLAKKYKEPMKQMMAL